MAGMRVAIKLTTKILIDRTVRRSTEAIFYQRLMLKTRRQISNIARAHLCITPPRCRVHVYLAMATIIAVVGTELTYATETEGELIETETVSGEGVWIDPRLNPSTPAGKNKTGARNADQTITVKVWFDQQLLGTGDAYQRRAMELSNSNRRALRADIIRTLQQLSETSFKELRLCYENYKSKESFQTSNHTGSSMASHAPPNFPASPSSSPHPE